MSNFVPKSRLISSVTNSVNATVTTTEDHGYVTGMYVRVFVPKAYGMSIYQQALITVTGSNTFTTDLDTRTLLPFVAPTFVTGGQAFTNAQVIPITGIEDNTAG